MRDLQEAARGYARLIPGQRARKPSAPGSSRCRDRALPAGTGGCLRGEDEIRRRAMHIRRAILVETAYAPFACARRPERAPCPSPAR